MEVHLHTDVMQPNDQLADRFLAHLSSKALVAAFEGVKVAYYEAQGEQEKLHERLRALQAQIAALETLLMQVEGGDKLVKEASDRVDAMRTRSADQSDPEVAEEAHDERLDGARPVEEMPGPTRLAEIMASQNKGLVDVARLAKHAAQSDRYANERAAYGSLYGVLRQSSRWEKVGEGVFRDRTFTRVGHSD